VIGPEPSLRDLTFRLRRNVPVPYGWLVLNVGDTVGDFELADQSGRRVTLGELLATGPLVVYFYIKAKTAG